MENDIVIPVGKSLIQHGYFNDRIYLMKIHPEDAEIVKKRIFYLQNMYHYTKIVMKIPQSLENFFSIPNAIEEARIPGFYQGTNDALFISLFFTPERHHDNANDLIQKNLTSLHERTSPSRKNKSETIIIRRANPRDVSQLCTLYQSVFKTYPFPIHEPSYLKKLMDEGVQFFVGETSGKIIAAGSCEIDFFSSSVEMSDLAVNSVFTGLGISKKLLSCMEQHMIEDKIKTAYTICRSEPLSVNRLFAGAKYQFGGTLIKNTNICGNFENMNVWYKKLL